MTKKRRALFTAVAASIVGAAMATSAVAADMPELPSAIKDAGKIRIGTKCDYVPMGYLDNDGNSVGIEVEMGRQVAFYAFGDRDKVEFTCVTSANRIPSLIGGKIDLIIATMGINEKRKEVIDFSNPYSWGASALLVKADSSIDTLDALKGKTVVSLKGAWQLPWFEENLPEVSLLKLDTVADALQALIQGRADGYGHDYSVLKGIAKKNDAVRIITERYQHGFGGAGVRKGEPEWLAFVNAVMAKAWEDGTIADAIKVHVDEELQPDTLIEFDMSLAPK
ncbi:MAG: transporter substrate-binding domain-containing protein [Granulosicoccus sp.]